MLKTANLTFQYPKIPAIFYPDLNCEAGESLLILGQSGVGKSTLLHLLGGLMPPTAGNVIINNTDLQGLSPSKLDVFRGQNIGIIFQKTNYMQALTVRENLQFTRKLARLKSDKHRINEVLHKLAIPHKADISPNELSQGEQQRFMIARAIITEPSIILADEPTSALDDDNCLRVVELLQEIATEDKASLIIVTHDSRLKSEFNSSINLTQKL